LFLTTSWSKSKPGIAQALGPGPYGRKRVLARLAKFGPKNLEDWIFANRLANTREA
jgi:hypothetical protein